MWSIQMLKLQRKEQLSLYRNELNYMQTCWTVGYVIGQIPSNIVLTRIRPSIWIPSMEVRLELSLQRGEWLTHVRSFGVCSLSVSAGVLQHAKYTLFVSSLVCLDLHFCSCKSWVIYLVHADILSGLAEGSFYPGMQYVIGSWYRKDELAKRSCIFHTSSAIATMCSGYLMASVYHLGGRDGLAGWQWYMGPVDYVALRLTDTPGYLSSMELSPFLLLSRVSSSYLMCPKHPVLGT